MLVVPTLLLVASALSANALMSLPYQKCDTPNGCTTVNSYLVLDGGSSNTGTTDYSGKQVYQVSNGIKLNAPISRSYLVSASGNKYEMFKLKNRKISVDINVAGVQCGYNAAFYFSNMSPNAALGSGYCDGQATCNEMDIYEGNVAASAYTEHACSSLGGGCDPWGCGVNTHNSYANSIGPGKTIDSKKTYTVTTAFYTADGTDNGVINKITQSYSQDGKTVTLTALTESYCASADSTYWSSSNGFSGLTRGFDNNGMTLIFSFWGTGGTSMSWLDGGASANSACSAASGTNAVTFSNIKLEYINGNPPPVTTKTTTKPSGTTTRTTTTTKSSNPTGACAAKYSQCGGTGWTGPTCCASGSTCTFSNSWYSQCL